MAGELVVVTGANSGLGLETARKLAARSPDTTVILACRNPERAEAARLSIESTTGNARVRTMQLDLSSMDSVRRFAARFTAEALGPIDALVCNAGISRGSAPTVDGLDPVFETNHLGSFLLTLSLLGAMAPAGRVIAVSSDMHQPPGPKLTWPGTEALVHPPRGLSARGLRYSWSKLCNLYFVYELSRRLRANGSGIVAAAFNPGLMTETNFATTPTPLASIMKRVFASRVGALESSSAALTELAASRDSAAIEGLYFDRNASRPRRSSELSYDLGNAGELWQLSARLANIDLPGTGLPGRLAS